MLGTMIASLITRNAFGAILVQCSEKHSQIAYLCWCRVKHGHWNEKFMSSNWYCWSTKIVLPWQATLVLSMN